MSNWPSVPLARIAKPIERAEVPVTGNSYRQVGVKLWGVGAYERETIDGDGTQYKTLSRVEADDIIVNKIWARNGSVAVVPTNLAGCYVSGEFPTFTPISDKLDPRWFHWITKTRFFWDQCDAKSRGTSGKNRIRPERFLEIEIPLPPLPEQRRIVARIEELAAKINEARGLREKAILEGQAVAGAVAKKLFGQFSHRQAIESFTEVRGGIQKGPHRAPGANPIRYLTVAHVQRDRILTNDPRYFEVTPMELKRWRLLPGDVLIIEGNGSAEQIGRTALFRGEIEDCVHQNHVIRIRPECQKIMPEFLNCFLNSPVGQDEVQAQSRTTSGLRTLSVGRIKGIHVPVPPLCEQRRIVAELEISQRQVNALKQLQSETAAELDALLPSVLDKAFKGELYRPARRLIP